VDQDWQRNQGVFSGMVRGVSNPPEGSKILNFHVRTPTSVYLVPTSPKLVEGEVCELLR
jgi:hypothetical protein